MHSRTGNTCFTALKSHVSNGAYFTPLGRDVCERCRCFYGKAIGCFNLTCPKVQDCDKYKRIDGKCCEFECLTDDGLSNKAELAVILSLSIGLVLLVIMLIAVLYSRRQSVKKAQEQQLRPALKTQPESSTTEQTQVDKSECEPAASSSASGEGSHQECGQEANTSDLPPPYYPPENIVTVNKQGAQQPLPPNEPPPPYDKEESAV